MAGTEHGMIPGSHERWSGPQCRCGADWDWWAGEDGRCTTGAVSS